MTGKNNEDRYSVSAFYLPGPERVPSVLAVVADGIGGHKAGEVAAEIAVETISRVVAASDGSFPANTLVQAVIEASQAIYEQSEQQANQKGMGATCACGWIIGDRLFIVNVGDSRIYLLRGGRIHQVSTDHTWIQEALEHGAITPDQIRGHPNSHVIRRYLGSRQTVIPDIRLRLRSQESDEQAEANQGTRLMPGDQVLLCSDGLTDLVDDDEIQRVLSTYPLQEAVHRLIEIANQRGGHDNTTVVALEQPAGVTLPAGAARPAGAALPVDATQPVGAAIPSGASLPAGRLEPAQPAAVHPESGALSGRFPRRVGVACLGVGLLSLVGVLVVGALVVLAGIPLPLPGASGRETLVATEVPSLPLPGPVIAPRQSPLPPATQFPPPPATGQPLPTVVFTAEASPLPAISPSPFGSPIATQPAGATQPATLTAWPTNTVSP